MTLILSEIADDLLLLDPACCDCDTEDSCATPDPLGDTGTLENYISNDWEIFDGIEIVELTPYLNPEEKISCVRALCGSLTRREVALLSASSLGLEPDDLGFSVWISTLEGIVPKRHDTITRDDGTVWLILSAVKLTVDTRWRVLCRKQVAA